MSATAPSGRSGPIGRSLSAIRRGQWPRWVDRVAAAVLLVAVAAAAVWGVPRLREGADARSRERTAPEAGLRLEFPQAPAWLPEIERQRLEAAVRSELADRSIFDRRGLELAAAALEASGWFDPQVQVRRAGRDRVVVTASIRVPSAVVRVGRSDLVVDDARRLLPWSWAAGHAPAGSIAVVGVASPPPSRPGEVWESGELPAALEILRTISGRPWTAQLRELDVSRVAAGGAAILRTRGGSAIVWGRSGESGSVSEVETATKLAYLDRLHDAQGDLEAPPHQAFDLRLDYLALVPDPGTAPTAMAAGASGP